MSYSIEDFKKEFPDNDACLYYIFLRKIEDPKGWFKLKGRSCYQNTKGFQICPTATTIFRKSRTPLLKWFYALYIFSNNENISTNELKRKISVTHKTAWRMLNLFRNLEV